MQLDIFEDSNDVILRNLLAQAIERDDVTAARHAAALLRAERPSDDSLLPALCLVEVLETEAQVRALGDHDSLSKEQGKLDAGLAHATRILACGAPRWSARRWQRLAERAQHLPFDPRREEQHAAALFLRAQDWQSAENAVASIASWRRIPAPLAWMVQARLNLMGLQATWALIAELAWLSPRRLAALGQASPDRVLRKLVKEFGETFEGEGDASDLAWFPAWLLTHRSDLRDHLAAAEFGQRTPPEQAMRVMVELIGYETQGRQHDVVASRQALRSLHSGLYTEYIRIR